MAIVSRMAWSMLGVISLLALALVLACDGVEEADKARVENLADCETPMEQVEATEDSSATDAPPVSPGRPPVLTEVMTFGPIVGESAETLEPTVDPECLPSPVTNTPSPLSLETLPGGKPTPPVEATIPAEAIAEPIVIPLGKMICGHWGVCLTVNSVTFHPYKPESEGLDGILVDVTIENRGTSPLAYGVGEFRLVDSDRFAYSSNSGFGSPPLGGGEVPPGLRVLGQLLFDVAEGSRLGELRWDAAAAVVAIPMGTVVEP